MHKGKPKIVDNPSSKKLLDALKGAESLKLLLDLLPDTKKAFPGINETFQQLEAVQEQAEVLYLLDIFNELFSERGWIAYEYLSVDLMREAISAAE